MKEIIKAVLRQGASIFTDKDFDADVVKIVGVVLVAVGLIGWWYGKPDFQWIIGAGVPLIASGKFSSQG